MKYQSLAPAPGWVALVAKPESPWVQIIPIAALALDEEGEPQMLAPLGAKLVPVELVAGAIMGVVHQLLCWDLLEPEEQDSLLRVTEVVGRSIALRLGMGTTVSRVEEV